jgi:hypothetical protein
VVGISSTTALLFVLLAVLVVAVAVGVRWLLSDPAYRDGPRSGEDVAPDCEVVRPDQGGVNMWRNMF